MISQQFGKLFLAEPFFQFGQGDRLAVIEHSLIIPSLDKRLERSIGIVERADASKKHMGLTTWGSAPNGKIVKADVTVAKNYLSEQEMRYLERIVTMYLDYAELQAERKIPMSMEDWAKRLDGFLEFNGNELLTGPGKISAEQAKLHAETEFEKYRIIQDRLYKSDFDRFLMLEQSTHDALPED